jgi:hypothetical protein
MTFPPAAGHPRWAFHFTPTSCSRLNAVETFFSGLTRRRLKTRHLPLSIVELQAINLYIAEHNANPPDRSPGPGSRPDPRQALSL